MRTEPNTTKTAMAWRTVGSRRRFCGIACLTALVTLASYLTSNINSQVRAEDASQDFADSASCAHCHADIAATYQKTAMANSFHRASDAERLEDFSNRNTLYNHASNRYYRMEERDGLLYELRHQIDFDGTVTNEKNMRIDYVIGSGSHARTYLHRTSEGKLLELPVSWYSERGGFWDMSPGYDNATQQDFRRPINFECMTCHNAYPTGSLSWQAGLDENLFGRELPQGIDCQRCHGPGAAHVRAASQGANSQKIRATIVNPANLSRGREMDTCMQCHLETTSLPLPHSIRRVGSSPFGYRPGTPLEGYKFSFDHAPGSPFDQRFEVAQQAYRLKKSACYLKSQMTCTTCHDPHQQLEGDQASEHYIKICLSCHQSAHPAGAMPANQTSSTTTHPGLNCLNCHMWKRRTDDAIHVVMTDHYIQRYKPTTDFLAILKEVTPIYRGEVVRYPTDDLTTDRERELYLALAQTEDGTNLEAGTIRLKRAIETQKPKEAEFYFALGAAYSKEGENAEAVRWYEEALTRHPNEPRVLRALATTLLSAGDLATAAEVDERATVLSDTKTLTDLGNIYLRKGDLEKARVAFGKALAIDPELPDAETSLGLVCMQSGDMLGAVRAFKAAINLQPDLAESQDDLAIVLARQGKYEEASFHFQKAVESGPTLVQVRKNYGIFLANTGSVEEGIRQLKTAVELTPHSIALRLELGDILAKSGDSAGAIEEFTAALSEDNGDGAANLALANLLSSTGRAGEARPYYERAAKVGDSTIRKAATTALQLGK